MSWGSALAVEILEEFASTLVPVREWRERLFEYRREKYLERVRERVRANAQLPGPKLRIKKYQAVYQKTYRVRPEAIEARRARTKEAKAKATRKAYESRPDVRARINRLTALRKAKAKRKRNP